MVRDFSEGGSHQSHHGETGIVRQHVTPTQGHPENPHLSQTHVTLIGNSESALFQKYG